MEEREKLDRLTYYGILYSIHYTIGCWLLEAACAPSQESRSCINRVHLSQGQPLLDIEPNTINNPGKEESQDRLTCCPVTVITLG